MGYASTIRRSQKGNDQPELDTTHPQKPGGSEGFLGMGSWKGPSHVPRMCSRNRACEGLSTNRVDFYLINQ
jgi:hypothetical protein